MPAFTVYGIAQPAGSKKAFAHRTTGRIIVTDDAKHSRPWKAAVTAEAATLNTQLLDGPLRLDVTFVIPRPKGHYGKHGILPSARPHPTVKPDATKLLRAVEDALNGVLWRDDAQIVHQTVRKVYGEPARAEIRVTNLEETHVVAE